MYLKVREVVHADAGAKGIVTEVWGIVPLFDLALCRT
jgi:hypothetical protein